MVEKLHSTGTRNTVQICTGKLSGSYAREVEKQNRTVLITCSAEAIPDLEILYRTVAEFIDPVREL